MLAAIPSHSNPRVLFVDDERQATLALIRSLERNGADYEYHYTETATHALDLARELRPEVCVTDLSLIPTEGPEGGLKLLSALIDLDPTVRVLVLTGHGSQEYGIRALQAGAASFLCKPIEVSHLAALIRDGISCSSLKRRYQALLESPTTGQSIAGLSSASAAMQRVFESALFAATTNQPILLLGQTGTGKGVLAQAIHSVSGRRGPFIRFQPSFGSYDLVSSELFGHQKGAFTGAHDNRKGLILEANGGTLFIDEIDELPKETQVALLHVIQEKRFRPLGSNRELRSDFRLISATNRPLKELLPSGETEGRLRQDLFHRIAHVSIELPPLKERSEDIEGLANQMLHELANRENLRVSGLDPQAVARLKRFSWPGNIRQLQAVLEDAVYRANYRTHQQVLVEDLHLPSKSEEASFDGQSFRKRVNQFEVQIIKDALTKCNNNQKQAADLLQMDRSTLRRILSRSAD